MVVGSISNDGASSITSYDQAAPIKQAQPKGYTTVDSCESLKPNVQNSSDELKTSNGFVRGVKWVGKILYKLILMTPIGQIKKAIDHIKQSELYLSLAVDSKDKEASKIEYYFKEAASHTIKGFILTVTGCFALARYLFTGPVSLVKFIGMAVTSAIAMTVAGSVLGTFLGSIASAMNLKSFTSRLLQITALKDAKQGVEKLRNIALDYDPVFEGDKFRVFNKRADLLERFIQKQKHKMTGQTIWSAFRFVSASCLAASSTITIAGLAGGISAPFAATLGGALGGVSLLFMAAASLTKYFYNRAIAKQESKLDVKDTHAGLMIQLAHEAILEKELPYEERIISRYLMENVFGTHPDVFKEEVKYSVAKKEGLLGEQLQQMADKYLA